MTVGLPGVGIGGLFYLISALLMPVRELLRRSRGEPAGPWGLVAGQWMMAAGIIGALWGTGWILGFIVPVSPATASGVAPGVTRNVIRISALALSIGTLSAVLIGVQVARLMTRVRGSGAAAPRLKPVHAATGVRPSGDPDHDVVTGRGSARRSDPSPLRRKSLGRSPEAG